MIAMGIPLNQVVLTMLQPAVDIVNRYNSYSIGYSAALTELKLQYAKLLKAESFEALTEEQKKTFDEDLPQVTVSEMEKTFGKQVSDMKLKEVKLQVAILRNVLTKANNASDFISIGSKAYSVLKEFPIDFPEMESVLEAFDKMWQEGEVEDPETGKMVNVNKRNNKIISEFDYENNILYSDNNDVKHLKKNGYIILENFIDPKSIIINEKFNPPIP